MEQGVVDSPVVLVIKAPDQKYDDQTISCFLNWTVEKLKSHLSNVYPSKPRSKDQRLVYSGKLLQDHCKLRDVLRKHDEFHMLHLVCASHSPPPSPKTRRRSSSNQPTNSNSSRSPAPTDNAQSASSDVTPDRLNLSSSSIYTHPSSHGSSWTQWFNQQQHNTSSPHYPMYTPHTLLWWQQLYTWHCHMTYQTWLSSLGPSQQFSTSPFTPVRDAEAHDNPPVAPVGAGLIEDALNRDWLDWVYAASRAVVLLSLVYFYSSFSRFVMVTGAMLLLYLHQAGWLPFNLENELQDLAEPANHNQDEPNADNHDNTDRPVDEGGEEEEQQEGHDHDNDDDDDDDNDNDDDEDDDDANDDDDNDRDDEGWVNMGFLSSTWSFITTFFASLIPEAIPNAVN